LSLKPLILLRGHDLVRLQGDSVSASKFETGRDWGFLLGDVKSEVSVLEFLFGLVVDLVDVDFAARDGEVMGVGDLRNTRFTRL
jgi:hypothetical protein